METDKIRTALHCYATAPQGDDATELRRVVALVGLGLMNVLQDTLQEVGAEIYTLNLTQKKRGD